MNNIDAWLTSPKTIQKSKKKYAHFDGRTDLSKCRNYVSNPQMISIHGFLPFIHYTQTIIKYDKSKGVTEKERDICYASHLGRCIFQYYNYILNEIYNKRIWNDGMYSVPIAYKTDLHKNNAHFAKIAFDLIRSHSKCYIMIGDFTHFFDNIDHQYLKRQLCSLLKVDYLPKDYYAIFKNITRYSKWELDDLLKLNGLKNTKQGWRILNSKRVVLSHEQFDENRSHIQKNPNPYGIPQGASISSLLANVYMLDVDKHIHDLISSNNGLYMRYSDDFIIVLPQKTEAEAVFLLLGITDYLNSIPGLTLKNEKTQYFLYEENRVENCGNRFHKDANNKSRLINFLGFTFDGEKVRIRSGTTARYYHKMYRKARTIVRNRGYTSKGNKISCKNLYMLYSIRGASGKRGNYLSYVNRCKNIFGPNEDIERDTKRHMQKIRKALKSDSAYCSRRRVHNREDSDCLASQESVGQIN